MPVKKYVAVFMECATCSGRLLALLQDDDCDRPMFRVRQTDVGGRSADRLAAPVRLSSQHEDRRLGIAALDFDVQPGNPFRPSCAECFEERFFGCESHGVM